MQVDVESSDRFTAAAGFSSRNRSRNVPIVIASPSSTTDCGTGRSLTLTPLVDWLS